MEFYLVLPGRCNAQCPSCEWEQTRETENYLEDLKNMLDNWPTLQDDSNIQYCPLYLIGGEATISPFFEQVVDLIQPYRNKFSFTSLVTNGAGLMDHIEFLEGKITQVVITRYHNNDLINNRHFGAEMLSCQNIAALTRSLNKHNITAAMNVPMVGQIGNQQDVFDMIQFAKLCGTSSINFETHSPNANNPLRDSFSDFIVINTVDSPQEVICSQIIDGYTVKWIQKNSDPKQWSELILLPNMRLTSDWKGQQGYHLREGRLIPLKKKKKSEEERRNLFDTLFKHDSPPIEDLLSDTTWTDRTDEATDSFHKTIQELLRGKEE